MLTISSEVNWPFRFIAKVPKENGNSKFKLYSYTPRSDYLFSVHTCPLIPIEVCSKPNKIDEFRMLLQAGLLVRVVNSQKQKERTSEQDAPVNPFVAIAIYITGECTANRYIVYQAEGNIVGIPEPLFADHSN